MINQHVAAIEDQALVGGQDYWHPVSSCSEAAMKLVIRSAITLYERDYVARESLRVWELRQHFCQAIDATAYFSWQLFADHRLLKDHYFLANIVKDAKTEILLLAIQRRLRPPSMDERADVLYYVSIRHRRKLWHLISKGIEAMSVVGPSDKTCTIVRAIEANYVEMAASYSFPDTVQKRF